MTNQDMCTLILNRINGHLPQEIMCTNGVNQTHTDGRIYLHMERSLCLVGRIDFSFGRDQGVIVITPPALASILVIVNYDDLHDSLNAVCQAIDLSIGNATGTATWPCVRDCACGCVNEERRTGKKEKRAEDWEK